MKTIDPHEGENNKIFRKRLLAILFVVAVICIAAVCTTFTLRLIQNPVIDLNVTELRSVKLINSSTQLEFDVDPQRWSVLVNNFRSSSATWGQTNWPYLAIVKFEFQDGRTYSVSVYDTGREPGRFRIGRIQYVGGDERLLFQLLDDEFSRRKRENRMMGRQPR